MVSKRRQAGATRVGQRQADGAPGLDPVDEAAVNELSTKLVGQRPPELQLGGGHARQLIGRALGQRVPVRGEQLEEEKRLPERREVGVLGDGCGDPYDGDATGILEQAERQVFDVLALNVHDYLPGFDKGDVRSRRFSLRLLRQAIENSPAAVQKIIQEVLNLPRDKQRDLADLLEKTSLSAIVNAAKTVADRLEFLRGLQLLVFDPVSEQQLKERSQLHRFLADHTWVFGDEFTLTVDDQSLTEVLRAHLRVLGRDPKTATPVKRTDGRDGIVDLMLSKRVPMPDPEEREHLVVELKRPKQKVTNKEADQIIEYAVAVAQDKQFRDVATKWVFWVVSNEMDANVRRKVRQRHRPEGLLHDDEEHRIVVWVKTLGSGNQRLPGQVRVFPEAFGLRSAARPSPEKTAGGAC